MGDPPGAARKAPYAGTGGLEGAEQSRGPGIPEGEYGIAGLAGSAVPGAGEPGRNRAAGRGAPAQCGCPAEDHPLRIHAQSATAPGDEGVTDVAEGKERAKSEGRIGEIRKKSEGRRPRARDFTKRTHSCLPSIPDLPFERTDHRRITKRTQLAKQT